MLPHFSTNVSDDCMPILKLNLKLRVWQSLHDSSFQFYYFLLSHKSIPFYIILLKKSSPFYNFLKIKRSLKLSVLFFLETIINFRYYRSYISNELFYRYQKMQYRALIYFYINLKYTTNDGSIFFIITHI